MARRILAIAFVLAAFAPGAFVSAQSTTQSTGSHTSSTRSSTATARHSASPNGRNRNRHSNVPPWANSVYVNGGTAAQYLATPKPKPPPAPNKVNTNGEVFKSISN